MKKVKRLDSEEKVESAIEEIFNSSIMVEDSSGFETIDIKRVKIMVQRHKSKRVITCDLLDVGSGFYKVKRNNGDILYINSNDVRWIKEIDSEEIRSV